VFCFVYLGMGDMVRHGQSYEGNQPFMCTLVLFVHERNIGVVVLSMKAFIDVPLHRNGIPGARQLPALRAHRLVQN
jgi:hypothetical protein